MGDVFLAVKTGDVDDLNNVIAQRPKCVNDRDPQGLTPLHHAAVLPSPQVQGSLSIYCSMMIIINKLRITDSKSFNNPSYYLTFFNHVLCVDRIVLTLFIRRSRPYCCALEQNWVTATRPRARRCMWHVRGVTSTCFRPSLSPRRWVFSYQCVYAFSSYLSLLIINNLI